MSRTSTMKLKSSLDLTYFDQRFLQVLLELFLVDGICLHCAIVYDIGVDE